MAELAVTVIGVDGGPLPEGAEEALGSAALVVGARRHLDAYAPEHVRTFEAAPVDSALGALSALSGGESGVVLAAGDPGLFGALRTLRTRGIQCSALPAVSGVQRLMARLGRSWDDVEIVRSRGDDLSHALNVCRAHPAVVVLTSREAGPAQLGTGLVGWRRSLTVGEDLGGPDERVSTVDPAEAASRTWHEPSVVFCARDVDGADESGWRFGGEPVPPSGWALPEDAFSHREGLITGSEVRALAMARLAPRPGALVWDVGAGSGAVAIECARLGAATIAVESDEAQVVRLVSNAAAHGVDVRVEEGEAPRVLRELPRPDSVFVGTPSAEVVAACAYAGAARIVVELSGLERVAATRDALRGAGYQVEGVQLAAARLAEDSDGSSRLRAADPIVLVSGVTEQEART